MFVRVGVEVEVDCTVAVSPDVDVAVNVAAKAVVGVRLGTACSVCAIAAETVPATIVSICPVSTVRVGRGTEEVESPGITQAGITARKMRAIKNVRLFFMFCFLNAMK